MHITVYPGETVRLPDGVTLTVLAVEGDLVLFRVEPPEPGPPPRRPERDVHAGRWAACPNH